jgi:hypothetical protein
MSKEQQSTNDYNKLMLDIIHKEASESLKLLYDNINSINTRLAILVGFNTTFITFFSKISNQKYPLAQVFLFNQDNIHSIHYINQTINSLLGFINWLSFKPLVGSLLVISLLVATNGLLTIQTKTTLLPKQMLEKSKGADENSLLKGIINNCDDVIQDLQVLVKLKASKLKFSLIFLEVAAIIIIIASILGQY